MKTIEERAKEYAPAPFDPDEIIYTKKRYVVNVIRDAYIVGANAQKAIDEEVRLKKCDDMTEAEYNRETAFVDWYLENGKGMPAYSDAIEWARKDLLDKACEWIKENFEDYVDVEVSSYYIYDKQFVEDFRKAMEEEL